METVHIDAKTIKQKRVITLRFPYAVNILEIVRTIPHTTWSSSSKFWLLPYSPEAIEELNNKLTNVAALDWSAFEQSEKLEKLKPPTVRGRILSVEHQQEIELFIRFLRTKRYSSNTIATYTDSIRTFLKYNSPKPSCEITNEDLMNFNDKYVLANNYSASFQNQVLNAVKLFFTQVKNRQLDVTVVHRPKQPKLLPNVLSKEEVKMILCSLSNVKHRAMLSLIYSCGLRRSELLHLKITDIESKRGLIVVRGGKGNKDRIAPLSEKITMLLREYYQYYKPKIWLFEGQTAGMPYSEQSLSHVLKQAVAKTGIRKEVSLHWLRHSYATHLLENGTDLRYIQEILGHKSSKTTEIYTHVSTKSIQNIKSPFDEL